MRVHCLKIIEESGSETLMQDFFDSRILAMDTDFRMLSAQHYGNLPGIDLAYILDGAAYHTEQDTVDRIRKGTVQVNTNCSKSWIVLTRGSSFMSATLCKAIALSSVNMIQRNCPPRFSHKSRYNPLPAQLLQQHAPGCCTHVFQ